MTATRKASGGFLVMMPPQALMLFGLFALILGAGSCLWLGGAVASVVSGNSSSVPWNFGAGPIVALIQNQGVAGAWPGTSPILVVGSALFFFVALVVSATISIVLVRGRLGLGGPPGMGTIRDLQAATAKELIPHIRRLRPSLANREVVADDLGFPLGSLSGTDLYSGVEATCLMIAAPRSRKTTGHVIPSILGAPGPVLATSNKADVVQATKLELERQGKRVWIFDPQGIVAEPQSWFWNPLQLIESYTDAYKLATLFIPDSQDSGQKSGKFFEQRGREYLTFLFLAAAVSPERSLHLVVDWLDQPRDHAPYHILKAWEQRTDPNMANPPSAGLMSMMTEKSKETIESVFSTASAACGCFRSREIMKWVTPSAGSNQFQSRQFVRSTDALHMVSLDGDLSAAPLVASFVRELLTEASEEAQRQANGRLDPPMTAVLDEAANIVRIPQLPSLYSYFGSKGIMVSTILQNFSQAKQVWGKDGADALWSASIVKLIGSGIDDPELAETISKFIGDHDVTHQGYSSSQQGGSSSMSVHRERIMSPAQIREIPKGEALLMLTGTRPCQLKLPSWFDRPEADRLAADIEIVGNEIAGRSGSPFRSAGRILEDDGLERLFG